MSFNVHHIGILIKNTQRSIAILEGLGFKVISTYYDDSRKINYTFIHTPSVLLELVCPESDSKYNQLYSRYTVGTYHTCYETDDFDKSCHKIRKMKFFKIGETEVAKVGESNRMCFFYNPDIGLIELYEGKN